MLSSWYCWLTAGRLLVFSWGSTEVYSGSGSGTSASTRNGSWSCTKDKTKNPRPLKSDATPFLKHFVKKKVALFQYLLQRIFVPFPSWCLVQRPHRPGTEQVFQRVWFICHGALWKRTAPAEIVTVVAILANNKIKSTGLSSEKIPLCFSKTLKEVKIFGLAGAKF